MTSTCPLISFMRSFNADIKILTIYDKVSTNQMNHFAPWTALLHHRAKEPHRVLDSIVTSQSKRTTPRPGQHCYITEQKNHTASWTALLHHRAFLTRIFFRSFHQSDFLFLADGLSFLPIQLNFQKFSDLCCLVLCRSERWRVSYGVC